MGGGGEKRAVHSLRAERLFSSPEYRRAENLQRLPQPLIVEFMPQVSPKAPTGDGRGRLERITGRRAGGVPSARINSSISFVAHVRRLRSMLLQEGLVEQHGSGCGSLLLQAEDQVPEVDPGDALTGLPDRGGGRWGRAGRRSGGARRKLWGSNERIC